QHAVSVLTGQQQALAVAIGYGPGRLVTPFADAIRKAARRAGLELRDVLRVENDRYWSYLCRNPDCCPPQGVPLEPGHPAGAAMGAAGPGPTRPAWSPRHPAPGGPAQPGGWSCSRA